MSFLFLFNRFMNPFIANRVVKNMQNIMSKHNKSYALFVLICAIIKVV